MLVHFSTVMARDQSLVFPDDVKNAMTLRGTSLAFSTIQKGDRFDPTDTGKGGAEGSTRMLVDIAATTRVLKVHPSDMGSYIDNSGRADGMGSPPTAESCARSIDDRNRSNEWLVQDYEPLGIFILPPLLVRGRIPNFDPATYAEMPIDFDKLADHVFPDLPIFTANGKTYGEFDRASRTWKEVGINDIYR